MSSTTLNISKMPDRHRLLTSLWEGVLRVAEAGWPPFRVPPEAFDAIADGGTVEAAALLPDLAGRAQSFFSALVSITGAQGELNAGEAAEFVAEVASLVPVNKADLAALARASRFPLGLQLMTSRDELRIATGKDGRLAAHMTTASGHELWMHRNEAGEDVMLIVALPCDLYAAMKPARCGERAPRFGLAA